MSYIERAKQNKVDRDELAAYRSQKSQMQMQQVADMSRSEGADNAYADVMQQLDMAAANQNSPIVSGSPADMDMQRNMDAGYNYQPPENEGLLDAISSQLGKASSSVSDWFSNAIGGDDEPAFVQSDRGAQAEEDARQSAYNSAFSAAEISGDTSEENMNNLVIQELNKRGL